MTIELNVAIRTSNSVGFIAKSEGLWLNTDTLELEAFNAANYADYIIAGSRVGSTVNVKGSLPAGAPAALYDFFPVEAVGTDGQGAGGFAEAYDQPAGGFFTARYNGVTEVDDLGDDVDADVALVTLTEQKQYSDVADTDSDAILAALINSCSEWIAGLVGRDLVQTTHTEYYHGDGSDMLILSKRPVVSITSIHIDSAREWAAATLIASTNYQLDKQAGMVRAWSLLGNWVCGTSNIRVIYVAGYTAGPEGTMPKDLKLAVMRLVDHQWRDGFTNRKLDVSSDVIGDANRTFRDAEVPKDVERILHRYRNFIGSEQFDYAD